MAARGPSFLGPGEPLQFRLGLLVVDGITLRASEDPPFRVGVSHCVAAEHAVVQRVTLLVIPSAHGAMCLKRLRRAYERIAIGRK